MQKNKYHFAITVVGCALYIVTLLVKHLYLSAHHRILTNDGGDHNKRKHSVGRYATTSRDDDNPNGQGLQYDVIQGETNKSNITINLDGLRERIHLTSPVQNTTRVYKRGIGVNDMKFNMHADVESTYPLSKQKKCAVVGNSGILLKSRCGEEINSNDFVIRINGPDIRKFVSDVGYKTNLTMINNVLWTSLYQTVKYHNPSKVHMTSERELVARFKFLNDSTLLFTAPVPESAEKLTSVIDHLKSKHNLPIQIAYIPDHKFQDVVKRLFFLDGLPTQGMRAVVIALALCEEVHIYGFYPYNINPQGTYIPFHYYELSYAAPAHDWNMEFEILEILHNNDILRLVTGECEQVENRRRYY
uniref:Cmp-n-acetylneuraminate-poly-alpha-28-sialyltransferase-like 086 n=1 Tax=Saccoglossus kowalevskii TaxID=10224 RepID=A0A0U2STD5_SACKO|nr:cmp-n-acetylneuraminate-poly-alpha-28-sialyltransferase-like 086 [Saccoglossus kowalevskii]